MASEHETLVAEFVSPFFVEQFGERDAQGHLEAVNYFATASSQAQPLLGVVLHDLRISDEVADEHGTHLRDEIEEILDINVPRVQAWGVFDPKTEAKVTVPRYPGASFTVLEVLSLSATWARLRVNRPKVTRLQRGGVEHGR